MIERIMLILAFTLVFLILWDRVLVDETKYVKSRIGRNENR